METFAPLLAYGLALSIAALIPGPGVAALVGQSLGGGMRTAVFLLVGIALGDLIYLTLAVQGLAAFAQLFAGAFLVVKALGGAYLLYLAYRFWTSDAEATQLKGTTARSGWGALVAGFLVTIGNPKTVIFYLALLPGVIDLHAVTLGDWATLAVVTVGVLFVTLTPYAYLAARARGMMARSGARSGALARLNRWASAVIGAAGVLILGQAAVALSRRG